MRTARSLAHGSGGEVSPDMPTKHGGKGVAPAGGVQHVEADISTRFASRGPERKAMVRRVVKKTTRHSAEGRCVDVDVGVDVDVVKLLISAHEITRSDPHDQDISCGR